MTKGNEFCQTYQGWRIYFSSENEGFYAEHANGQSIGYVDSEAEILEEIDCNDISRENANRGPFAYLGAQ